MLACQVHDRTGLRFEQPLQLRLLDVSRGAAALWVVMFHACVAYIINGHGELLSNPIYAFSVRGQTGVGIFFAISGYCIVATLITSIQRRRTLADFAVNRSRRIFPPYLAALACITITAIITIQLQTSGWLPSSRSQDSPFAHDLSYWLANLSLTQLWWGYTSFMPVSWSLSYEIAFYCAAGVCWWLLGASSHDGGVIARRLIGCLNALSLISISWLAMSRDTCPFPLNRWYQFGLGIALFTLVNRRMVKAIGGELYSSVAVIALVLAYGLVIAPMFPVYAGYTERTPILCVVGFVMLILGLAHHEHKLCKGSIFSVFQKLGKMSYSLYLFHMIPMPFMDAGLRRAGLSGGLYIFNFVLQIAAAISSGWLFYRLVESRCLTANKPTVATPIMAPTTCPQ